MFKKVFITGSEGFIGSHLTEYLLNCGLKVKALVLYNSFNSKGWLENLNVKEKYKKNLDIVFGDVRNSDGLKHAMKDCDTVVHLAALIGIPYSYITQESYLETNTKGTLNILQNAKLLRFKKVLVTSTSEVYGTGINFPMSEKHPLNAQSPYAASKIAADAFAHSFNKSFDLPVSIIRPFNTFGPRQSARAVIPTIITQILNEQKFLNLGNTSPLRDFLYVEDLCKGFYLALKKNIVDGEVFNISSGYAISISKLAKIIKKKMNSDIIIKTTNERQRPKKSEVNKLLGCNKKFIKFTNWKPNYCGYKYLNKGLDITIEWFIKNYKKNTTGYIV